MFIYDKWARDKMATQFKKLNRLKIKNIMNINIFMLITPHLLKFKYV